MIRQLSKLIIHLKTIRIMKRDYRFIYLFVVAVFVMTSTITAQDYFSNFPVRANPKIVGKKVSSRLMETKHQLYGDRGIHYAEVCTWYGGSLK